jgi:geranylgeranyl diphosphate synthase type I
MPTIFFSYKKQIDAFLRDYLTEKRKSLSSVNQYGNDLVERILPIVTAGKTIRGSLVLLTYCFTHKKPSTDAIKAATALELMQTALLVHDDIMDKDDTRRGLPSLHVQYKSEAMAMCVGDILFFMAFELLGSMDVDAKILGRILRFVGREYQMVGVAQMTDVASSAKSKIDIVRLYTYKTARYTFAVPLMLGAMIAGTTRETLRYLESYGVAVGVLFQIRDDMLDNENNLFTQADVKGYKKAAEESLIRLPVDPQYKKILSALSEFVITRNK